ncbi:hypothetical protein LNKW23_03360 [Paralimibaculum aggregatum]|uniref:Uncharacterized protein n=1 Tax=Paralimibaculum aggregatum TaxID=3036245 RepID=A0ABQ6LCM4_9RHOB|nr:DUF6524 family protein [Limibaculum sp. NKW23]GMG81124.1 hypothetical protein LNKW23_03360 [Limibaculum sp. NKW23]
MLSQNTFTGMLIRIAIATVIVLLTYNPTGYLSYVHWLKEGGVSLEEPTKIFVGLLLIVCYVVLLRATLFSIGVAGVALVAALLAALVWVLAENGVFDLANPGVVDWLVLIGLGLILGIGLSWAIIRRRLSGQVSVDDVEDT